MVDNVSITSGSGTAIAADDLSGVYYQRVKISWGVDGSAVDASASNPFPVVINTNGQATMANSTPVAIASNQSAVAVKNGQAEYETVAASQTDQALGATGGTGDYLAGVLIIPGTTSPGAVSIKDGSGSSVTIFTGGASSVVTTMTAIRQSSSKARGSRTRGSRCSSWRRGPACYRSSLLV